MNKQIQIAQNNGRYYRVSLQQSRYFPIARDKAQQMLMTGEAREVAYLPFSRPDLSEAYRVAQLAVTKASGESK